uniref:MucB/RseB C-terminal domain-containing protein n=1 Tax=Pseudomonas laurentiana TaxID=2364649 RepID=UPI0029C9693C|nr:MucB/RseB C-terminal domain-containing protein [Pseudomonas laurentiana]
MRALPLIPLLLGVWLTGPAFAANSSTEAADWLSRLAKAEQRQSYQGTFVYERNGSFSTHEVWHRVQDGKVSERLVQLDGAAQEVVRVDGITRCVSGALLAEVSSVPAVPGRVLDPLKLMNWYDLGIAGHSRVAGHDVTIVTLSPRDQHRYAFELHLDRDTGLPLKSLMINDKGQLLERFQFTHLDTANGPSDTQLQPSDNCKPVEQASVEAVERATGWRSDWLPPGFELVNSSVRKSQDGKRTVSSLMYDDGLARFSVFVEPSGEGGAVDARTQLGPTVAVSRRLTTPKGDMAVTVVGEIPIGTAERVALSMRAQEAQAKQ